MCDREHKIEIRYRCNKPSLMQRNAYDQPTCPKLFMGTRYSAYYNCHTH